MSDALGQDERARDRRNGVRLAIIAAISPTTPWSSPWRLRVDTGSCCWPIPTNSAPNVRRNSFSGRKGACASRPCIRVGGSGAQGAQRWRRGAMAAFRPQVTLAHEHAHPHVTWLQRLGARWAAACSSSMTRSRTPGATWASPGARRRDRGAARRRARSARARGVVRRAPAGARARSDPGPCHSPRTHPEAGTTPSPPAWPPAGADVRRMEGYKGLDVLLAAFQRLGGSGAELEILGDGPELARLEAEFRRLPGVTVARGYASRPALLAALARADLVVAPYLEATQSGVVAGAFANGRPRACQRRGRPPGQHIGGRERPADRARRSAAAGGGHPAVAGAGVRALAGRGWTPPPALSPGMRSCAAWSGCSEPGRCKGQAKPKPRAHRGAARAAVVSRSRPDRPFPRRKQHAMVDQPIAGQQSRMVRMQTRRV